MMDAHYQKHFGRVLKLERYYRRKSDEELRLIYAELVREQQMIGNIPLLASTTPVIFLIFGGHVSKYFPHDSFGWLFVVVISILIIVWSINHHFRIKGRIGLDKHIVEQIVKERSQNGQTPVK
jgi:hypothetical protein